LKLNRDVQKNLVRPDEVRTSRWIHDQRCTSEVVLGAECCIPSESRNESHKHSTEKKNRKAIFLSLIQ